MSVATKNPFSVLDPESDDEQPQDAAPATDDAPPPPSSRPNTKRGGGPASRGGKYYARGGKPQVTKDSDPPAEDPDNQRQFDPAREAGRGGDGRGRGRGRGSGRGRGRPFDRHSQTGKTDSDKKIHQSWGGDDGNTELKTEQAASWDAVAESNDWNSAPADPVATADTWGAPATTTDDWGAPAATDDWGGPSTESTAAPVDAWDTAPNPTDAPEGDQKHDPGRPRKEREPDEDDNTLTLDQYLTQQKDKESAVPKLEGIRKANDGADDVWKGAVPLAKNDEPESYYVGKVKTAPKARAKKDEKVYIEIEARFDRPERSGGRGRGRGDRGDRGRGERSDRGRGDRGSSDRGFGDRGFGDRPDRGDRGERSWGGRGRGSRGGRLSDAAVDVDDPNAFPSLA